jgi:hypothetical protein
VAEPPAQIFVAELVTVKDGNGFTVTPATVELVQPAVLVPITVYVVVTVGDTAMVLPVKVPGLQL